MLECGAEAELTSSGRWAECGADGQDQETRIDSDVLFRPGRIKSPETAQTKAQMALGAHACWVVFSRTRRFADVKRSLADGRNLSYRHLSVN